MKKSLFLVAMLLIVSSSFAQYKPEAKSVSTEIQFNPFDQNGKTFKLDGVKVRYFISAKDAVRVKVGFNMGNDKYSDSDSEGGELEHVYSSYEGSFKTTSGDFNLNFGYERHFDVAKRLSVYVGGGLGFNRHFVSASIEEKSSSGYHDGDKWVVSSTSESAKIKNGSSHYFDDEPEFPNNFNRASWRFDAAVFTGLDFYVYKGLYLGTELGLGLKSTKYSKVTITSKSTMNGMTVPEHDIEIDDNVRNTTFGFYIEPTIRLGWTF